MLNIFLKIFMPLKQCLNYAVVNKSWSCTKCDWTGQNLELLIIGIVQLDLSKKKPNLTSLIANIIIGAITGTLILDSTRSALPRISWLGSWERRQQILNLTSCIQRVTIYLFLIHNNIQCNLEQGSSSLSEVTKRLTYFRHPFINHNGIDQSSLI